MKKIAKPFIWLIKMIIWGILFAFVIPIGITGVLYAIIAFIFRESKDLVEEQIDKA